MNQRSRTKALFFLTVIIFSLVPAYYLYHLLFKENESFAESYGVVGVGYSLDTPLIKINDVTGRKIVRVYTTIYALTPSGKGIEFVGTMSSPNTTVILNEKTFLKLKNISNKWFKVMGNLLRNTRISLIIFTDIIDEDGRLYSVEHFVPINYHLVKKGYKPQIVLTTDVSRLKPLKRIEKNRLSLDTQYLGCKLRQGTEATVSDETGESCTPLCEYHANLCVCDCYCSIWKLEKVYEVSTVPIPIIVFNTSTRKSYVYDAVALSFDIEDDTVNSLVALAAVKPGDLPPQLEFGWQLYLDEINFAASFLKIFENLRHKQESSGGEFFDDAILSIAIRGNITYGLFRRYERTGTCSDGVCLCCDNKEFKPTEDIKEDMHWIPIVVPTGNPNEYTFIIEALVDDEPRDNNGYLEKYYRYIKNNIKTSVSDMKTGEFSLATRTVSYDTYDIELGFDATAILKVLGINVDAPDLAILGLAVEHTGIHHSDAKIGVSIAECYSPSTTYYNLYESSKAYWLEDNQISIPLFYVDVTDVDVELSDGYKPLNKFVVDDYDWEPNYNAVIYIDELEYRVKASRSGGEGSSITRAWIVFEAETLLPGTLTLTSTLDYKLTYNINGYGHVALKYRIEVIDANTGDKVYTEEYNIFSYDTGPPPSEPPPSPGPGLPTPLSTIQTLTSGTKTYTHEIIFNNPGTYYIRIYIIAIAETYDDPSTATINTYDNGYIDLDLQKTYEAHED